MKQRSIVALAAALALSTAPAFAKTFYVPNPDTGGVGKPKSKVEVTPGGSRMLTPIFIATGANGTGLTGRAVKVDNDVKPNVFDLPDYITGPGMLKLVGTDVGVQSGSLFLSPNQQVTDWALPILSEDNWFTKNETAYIQGLSRTATGASNLEIMSFGAANAACQVQLFRPLGSRLGGAIPVTLVPLSHRILKDVLKDALHNALAGGVKAQVSCDQPFYAYGTFVDPNPFNFRMFYPLSAPSQAITETLSVNRNGTFFTPVEGNSQLQIDLPLVQNRAYRAVSIDFDVRISEFTPIFTGLVGMYHPGGPRFGKTLYFGTFVRGTRSRSLVDQGSPVVEPALQLNTAWKEGLDHHITIVYDTETATLRFAVFRDGKAVVDVTSSAYSLDLADRGAAVKLQFGLPGIADGAYYPPLGWKFSNLRVRITR